MVDTTADMASDISGSMMTVAGSRLTRICSCAASTSARVVGSGTATISFWLSSTTTGSAAVYGA